MRWQSYTLYRDVIKKSTIGQIQKAYAPIGFIECVVSHDIYTEVNGDVLYRKFIHSAISKYKGLDVNHSYVLVADGRQYNVDSFNCEGRYSQLVLSETTLKLSKKSIPVYLDGYIRYEDYEAIELVLNGIVELSGEVDILA